MNKGCKFLRELIFNHIDQEIMPRVVASLLKHLCLLEVVDMTCLHQAIEYYYKGAAGTVTYHPRPNRIAPLKLLHYTGSDKLGEVLEICPKLRTFKLFVTESLPSLGTTLQNSGNCLDHVTLVFNPAHRSLNGFHKFLQACGSRISSLQIETSGITEIGLEDLNVIAQECKFLDVLGFNAFVLSPDTPLDSYPEPFVPLQLPFLTELKLSNIRIDRTGKELFRFLIGGCPDIERISLSFQETAFFFSDFLLDDILFLNPLGRLEYFQVKDVSLTLISALRLISSRPKLRSVGQLLKWDVELSELKTFAQILRRANSLKLLQDISIN